MSESLLLDFYSFEKESGNLFISKKEKFAIKMMDIPVGKYVEEEFIRIKNKYSGYSIIFIPYRDGFNTSVVCNNDNYLGLNAEDLYDLLKETINEREIKDSVKFYLENFIEYLEVYYNYDVNKNIKAIEEVCFKYFIPIYIIFWHEGNLLDYLSPRQIDYLNRFYLLLRFIIDSFALSFPLIKLLSLIEKLL